MQKNEKSKKKTIEKLRMVLDKPFSRDLHPEDEKYLRALGKRLEESSKEIAIYVHRNSEEESGSLKPRVTIHRKEEKKSFAPPETKRVEPKEQEIEGQKESLYEDKSLYEVEKVKVDGPEFIEVKPKEITKKKEKIEKISAEETAEGLEGEKTNDIKHLESIDEELPEWEPVDVKKTEVKKLKEEKPESEEKLPSPISFKVLTKIKGIRRKLVKKIKKEDNEVAEKTDDIEESEGVDEWVSFHEDEIPEETKGYRHGDYTLYRKEIEVGVGKRTIHFFSKAEPDKGEPVELPDGFEVKVNKKTGVPYLRKKK